MGRGLLPRPEREVSRTAGKFDREKAASPSGQFSAPRTAESFLPSSWNPGCLYYTTGVPSLRYLHKCFIVALGRWGCCMLGVGITAH